MEPEEQPLFERVVNGTIRSAINGALMMGIYWSMMFTAGHFGWFGITAASVALPHIIGAALLVTAAVAVFGGIMASGLLSNHTPAIHLNRTPQLAQSEGVEMDVTPPTPGITRMPVPMIMPDTAPEMENTAPKTNWSDRPDIQAQRGRSSLEKILADGADGQSHAQAILAEQQTAGSAPTLH